MKQAVCVLKSPENSEAGEKWHIFRENGKEKDEKWAGNKENFRSSRWLGIGYLNGVTSRKMKSLQEYGTLNVRFWFADVISQFTEERPLTVSLIKYFNIRQKMLAKQTEGRI